MYQPPAGAQGNQLGGQHLDFQLDPSSQNGYNGIEKLLNNHGSGDHHHN